MLLAKRQPLRLRAAPSCHSAALKVSANETPAEAPGLRPGRGLLRRLYPVSASAASPGPPSRPCPKRRTDAHHSRDQSAAAVGRASDNKPQKNTTRLSPH